MGLEALVDAARFLEYHDGLKAQTAALAVNAFSSSSHPILQLQQQQPKPPSPLMIPITIVPEAVLLRNGNVFNIHLIMQPNRGNEKENVMESKPAPTGQPQFGSQGPTAFKRNQRAKERHCGQSRGQRAEFKRLLEVLKKELAHPTDDASPRSLTTTSLLDNTTSMIKDLTEEERLLKWEKDRLQLDKTFLEMKLETLQKGGN